MEKLNDLGVEKIFSLRTFLSQGQTLTGILSISKMPLQENILMYKYDKY